MQARYDAPHPPAVPRLTNAAAVGHKADIERPRSLGWMEEATMAMRVNYGLQRAERDRAKQAKKEAKAREKAAAASHADHASPDPAPEPPVAPKSPE
jgi:hypothetical protein